MNKICANDKIIKAYWDLADSNRITVSNICKKAKINRSTFYEYYIDVYDLSDKEENRIINELIEKVNKSFPDYIPTDISEFTKTIIDIFATYNKYIYILINNNSSNFQKKLKEELASRLTTVLGIESDNVYFKYITTYLISNVCSLLNCWYENKEELNVEEIAKLIHNLVFNGLLHYKER